VRNVVTVLFVTLVARPRPLPRPVSFLKFFFPLADAVVLVALVLAVLAIVTVEFPTAVTVLAVVVVVVVNTGVIREDSFGGGVGGLNILGFL